MQLSDIKGIKEKRLELLTAAGILTPVDLISFFPKKYLDLTKLTPLSQATDGEEVVFLAKTDVQPRVNYIRKGMSLVKIPFTYDQKMVYVTYFNQPYTAKNVKVGRYYYVWGKFKKQGNVIPNATLIPFTGDTVPVPIYGKIKGVPSSVLVNAIDTVLRSVTLDGYIPADLRSEYGLDEINEAYLRAHHPLTIEQAAQASRSVSIEYLNYLISVYSLIRRKEQKQKPSPYVVTEQWSAFVEGLPFSLTEDQKKALNEITSDMLGDGCNRLLQGDVGCGKTIVAVCAMMLAAFSGKQSVLMAPTEVLAMQHYENVLRLLQNTAVRAVFLSGSTKKAERENILQQISRGEALLVIGTHAVFSQDVAFKDLAFIVTDEQQRFGVNQRSALENKALDADVLAMSATPIPRTLALTLYGELAVSTIRSMPKDKAKVATRLIPAEKEEAMWRYVAQKAEEGEQTYVVCPRIEDEDDDELVSAKALFKEKSGLLGDKIALLHGQLKEATKTAVMREFAAGKTKVLVSTTVIEVGVDVKNATTMIIYNADRFGLSQLHQLRGRVGRGNIDSYCFVLSSNTSDSARQRLGYFASCADGFELAEYDFDQRGGGDFLGTDQHGKKGDFAINANNIATAKAIATQLLEEPDYCEKITKTITDNRFAYFSNITLN